MNYSADVRKDHGSSISTSLLMDNFLATNHLVCNLIGLPLNLVTAAYIVFKSRLHQTRNILWLGVAFSNVLVLLNHLVESYVHQFQSETAKNIFIFFAGLPYSSLMLNLFLSLVDRYVRVAHSVWYKRKVTITLIVSGQIGCFSILCVLMKGPYLIEIIHFSSQFTMTELKIVSIVGFVTLLLCAVGEIFVYLKVKYYLGFEKEADTTLAIRRRAFTRKEQITQTTEFVGGESLEDSLIGFHHQQTTASVKELVVTPSPFFVHIGGQEISRVELAAARTALDSVTLFLLFALPSFLTLNLTVYADCFPATAVTGTFHVRQDCSKYLWTLAYTRGRMLFYPVVNPILFTTRSRDLSQILDQWLN